MAPGDRTPTYRAGLKYRMSFADWFWSVIALALRLKNVLDILDTYSTQTGTAYTHLIYTTHQ